MSGANISVHVMHGSHAFVWPAYSVPSAIQQARTEASKGGIASVYRDGRLVWSSKGDAR